MTTSHVPRCCSPLLTHWPLPHALQAVTLVSTQFNPEQFEPDAFQRCAITPVRGVAKRQAEHLAGRLCAREALWRQAAIDYVPAVGEDRAPQWPASVCGSITHGHGWAAAVVGERSQWQGLGLDIEQRLAPERALNLASELLTPAELQRLQGLDETAQALQITLTFSLKESLFKALYPLVGVRFYFQDAEVLSYTHDGHAQLRLLTHLSDHWPAGSPLQGQFSVLPEQVLTLVAIPA
ncbi:4'-phosphopantetheinyl transferase [Pseudomonas sp. 21C1]|nr:MULTISPECIES: 4'-phosphopantetheinyl transferase superfamily protein [Pseudomonas]OEC36082.1 4'-phosphopantetheinyl transferase [Pseudomonas sp. 21C1]